MNINLKYFVHLLKQQIQNLINLQQQYQTMELQMFQKIKLKYININQVKINKIQFLYMIVFQQFKIKNQQLLFQLINNQQQY
ncbi:unnamed protein product [Paramecium pentaurelia]|uniref:Uncharacterized protein n=1 Tax=Paramecium pentaurelia TaxID=43138 RepID=A0A8S1UVM1_9CILI|nr:unnamed protein product [Paramecium pentaurelia]